MQISDALVDLGMFPIGDISVQPKLAQDILMVVSLVLEWLWEKHGSITSHYRKHAFISRLFYVLQGQCSYLKIHCLV
jgi:hypothetical protein